MLGATKKKHHNLFALHLAPDRVFVWHTINCVWLFRPRMHITPTPPPFPPTHPHKPNPETMSSLVDVKSWAIIFVKPGVVWTPTASDSKMRTRRERHRAAQRPFIIITIDTITRATNDATHKTSDLYICVRRLCVCVCVCVASRRRFTVVRASFDAGPPINPSESYRPALCGIVACCADPN